MRVLILLGALAGAASAAPGAGAGAAKRDIAFASALEGRGVFRVPISRRDRPPPLVKRDGTSGVDGDAADDAAALALAMSKRAATMRKYNYTMTNLQVRPA
jgi:hypothetical protein